MNIWEDRGSEWVCSVCAHYESNAPAVLPYSRPCASGAVGQYTGDRRKKEWQCPACGFMHCPKCANDFKGPGVVPREDGLDRYTGDRPTLACKPALNILN